MRKKYAKNRADCPKRCRSGLTIIELVVAFSMACIVFFATSTILVFGQRSLNHGWQQANLQRDVSCAQLKIKQSIRGATLATLDEDGNGVKIFHAAGWIRFWFVSGQKDLLYQLEGEDERMLLDGVVQHADFEVDGSKVTIGLELRDGDCETRLATTTMMRNYSAGT